MRATLLVITVVSCLLAGCSGRADTVRAAATPGITTSPAASASAKATRLTPKPSPKPSKPRPTTIKYGYSTKANAEAEIKAAMKAAKADGKNVLLDFGANWCGNCAAMGRTFTKPAVKSALASYHVVQINVDTSSGVLYKYDKSGSWTLPVLIVVNPSGEILVNTAKSGRPTFTETGFSAFLRKWSA